MHSVCAVGQNDPQLAYEFAVRHPGEAYFPWHPLASLLAEGRLYRVATIDTAASVAIADLTAFY